MYKLKIFTTLFIVFLGGFYFSETFFAKTKKQKIIVKTKTISNPPKSSPIDDSIKASSKRFYYETLVQTKFNGGILVARNNNILFEAYNGFEQLDSGKAIDSLTSFHLASTSKTFTGIAILKLFDSLALSIDQPVSNFLEGFPTSKITVRQLLNHRSGLPNYLNFIEKIGWSNKRNITNKELLDKMISKWHLLHIGKPDTYFEYSNTNYALLALIIEKVGKLSYPAYINDFIFKPLNMKKSFVFTIDKSDSVLPSFKSNKMKEPFMFLDEVYGDKNIYSTTKDLLKWDQALYDTNFLSSKIKEEAYKGYSFEKSGIRNYGLGWRLFDLPTGKKIIYHNGWWHGNNIVFKRFPQDSIVIIVLGNQYNTNIYKTIQIVKPLKGYESIIDENQ